MSTIFKKIIDKQIPAKVIFEDELCLCFHDINPQAPVHALLIPKKEIPTLQDVKVEDAKLMGHMITQIPQIAKKLGLDENGYRTVINTKGDGAQTVFHLHIHILGGRQMKWPPG